MQQEGKRPTLLMTLLRRRTLADEQSAEVPNDQSLAGCSLLRRSLTLSALLRSRAAAAPVESKFSPVLVSSQPGATSTSSPRRMVARFLHEARSRGGCGWHGDGGQSRARVRATHVLCVQRAKCVLCAQRNRAGAQCKGQLPFSGRRCSRPHAKRAGSSRWLGYTAWRQVCPGRFRRALETRTVLAWQGSLRKRRAREHGISLAE